MTFRIFLHKKLANSVGKKVTNDCFKIAKSGDPNLLPEADVKKSPKQIFGQFLLGRKKGLLHWYRAKRNFFAENCDHNIDPRGRCYDHNFLRIFGNFLQKKLAFCSKTNVMIKILDNLALF
jgi:hypothetical protein